MSASDATSQNAVTGRELDVFHTLNAMRGIAAIMVVIGHAPRYFGIGLPSAYLAVDLFFVLSGFVLAHAYEKRFANGLRTRTFMTLRYIRLMPFFALGLMISIAGVLIGEILGAPVRWTVASIAVCAIFNLLFLPAPPIHNPLLFPLNDPGWSLFFELFANLLLVMTWRVLSNRVLTGVACIAYAALAYYSFKLGGLGAGWDWPTFGAGIARVLFSFPVGILIYRLTLDRHPIRLATAPVVAVMMAVLTIDPGHFGAIYALCAVGVLLPAIVLLGSMTRPTRWLRLYTLMGVTSYGLYAIHKPLLNLADGAATRLVATLPGHFVPWLGMAFISVLLPVVWWLDKYFDTPCRRALAKKLRRTM